MESASRSYDSELFKSLILNFQVSAMIGLGKIVNPVTQKAEKDLNAAKVAIDMLSMIAVKTAGNLSEEENRLVQNTLTDLRLNYVTTKSQPEPGKEKTEVQAQTGGKENGQPDKKSSDAKSGSAQPARSKRKPARKKMKKTSD